LHTVTKVTGEHTMSICRDWISVLMMEAVGSSETLITTNSTARLHNIKGHSQHVCGFHVIKSVIKCCSKEARDSRLPPFFTSVITFSCFSLYFQFYINFYLTVLSAEFNYFRARFNGYQMLQFQLQRSCLQNRLPADAWLHRRCITLAEIIPSDTICLHIDIASLALRVNWFVKLNRRKHNVKEDERCMQNA
jgi:hypothetical protein